MQSSIVRHLGFSGLVVSWFFVSEETILWRNWLTMKSIDIFFRSEKTLIWILAKSSLVSHRIRLIYTKNECELIFRLPILFWFFHCSVYWILFYNPWLCFIYAANGRSKARAWDLWFTKNPVIVLFSSRFYALVVCTYLHTGAYSNISWLFCGIRNFSVLVSVILGIHMLLGHLWSLSNTKMGFWWLLIWEVSC